MTVASENEFPKVIFVEGAAPATPDAGEVKVYAKADGLMYSKDDAGVETLMSGGVATGIPATILDAKGDLIVASAADTAARLAVGGNGDYPRAASGASVGIEWQKNNLAASVAPTVNEDTGDGYSVGSRWIDTTNDKEYVCLDASSGAAVWTETTGSGSTADHNHTTTAGDGGDLDGARIGDFLEMTEVAAPSTPASGLARIYAKSDGRIYSKDDAGVEYGPFDAAGGAGPLLYADSLALHADGDEFTSATLSGAWTNRGSVSLSLDTDEVYDSTVLVMTMDAAGDMIHRAKPSATDFEIWLTCYGTDTTGSGRMPGIILMDGSGNGVAFSPYNDGTTHPWAIVSYVWSGNGPSISGVPWRWGTLDIPFILRLSKIGGSYLGYFSSDGGAHWLGSTVYVPSAFTPTRAGIGTILGSGSFVFKVGRINFVDLVDLVPGGTLSASTTNSTFVASNANDGDDGTWHIHTASTAGEWLKCDLGSAQSVQAFRVASTGVSNRICAAYDLESSPDNSTWTVRDVGTGRLEDSGVIYLRGGPVSARYWRIIATGTAGSPDPWAQGTFNLFSA